MIYNFWYILTNGRGRRFLNLFLKGYSLDFHRRPPPCLGLGTEHVLRGFVYQLNSMPTNEKHLRNHLHIPRCPSTAQVFLEVYGTF